MLSAVEQFAAAKGNGGEGALTVEGGRGEARELRKSDAKRGAEEVWNSGSTVSSSSPAFGWPVAAF